MTALSGMVEAYDAAAASWADGPTRLYVQLAEVLLDAAPIDIAGSTVLDVGSGTGVVAGAAIARGAATVVASDIAAKMLSHVEPPIATMVADAAHLPVADEEFDLVTAGCLINHMPDPVTALAEFRRVAPALVATTFAATEPHLAKAAVDEVATRHGWQPPAWYVQLKRDVAPRTEDPDRLAALAAHAGYSEAHAAVRVVPTGLSTAADLAAWRLGMAHLAPFVAALSPADYAAVTEEAVAAVDSMPPLTVDVVILSAR